MNTKHELSLCADCIYFDANGWDINLTGTPLPDPAPMSLLEGWLISPDETDHICEGHFSWDSCDGCGTFVGGDRYCYIGSEGDETACCPACGDHIDYCQGHGEMGDIRGYNILILHDDGNHSRCHPASDCREDN